MALFDFKGFECELPKKTFALAKKMDEIDLFKQTSRERAYKAEYPFVIDTLGRDIVSELCAGDSLETVDVDMLDILYVEIVDAYNAEIEAYNKERERKQLDRPAFAAIEKISKNMETIQKAVDKK